MTIDLDLILKCSAIFMAWFTVASMLRMMWKSWKQDKDMRKLFDEVQQEHIKFMDSMEIKYKKKPKLSVVEKKDKE